jgi:TetR/AcrR family transcriptional regulator, fatty acid metabolism regulator protein
MAEERKSDEAPSRRPVSRLPRERRIGEIMDAGLAIFRKKGYDDAMMSEIAELAGVVEGTIYRYFENKRDLLVKIVERWYEAMLVEEDRQLAGIRGTWNRLRYMIRHHLVTIRDEPALSRLVFMELRPDPRYRSTRLFSLNRDYTQRTLEVIQQASAAGELRSDLPLSLIRDMIFGGMEHYTWGFLRGEKPLQVDEAADAITEIIYRGLVRTGPDASAAALDRLEEITERLERLTQSDDNRS